MSKPALKVTSDFTQNVNDILKKFKNDAVLVGVPEQEAARKEDEPINNATILALNNFGSPANNILPWPVMSIGIRNAKDQIVEQFKLAAQKSLSEGSEALVTYYNRAGIIAANSIKKVINSQEGAPKPENSGAEQGAPNIALSTLRNRQAEGHKGKKRLIVTAQMRNSITYVVKGEE